MCKNKLGVQLFSVHKELQKDMRHTLKTVKDMGYEGVEFFGGITHTVEEYKEALNEAGLVCCGWHTPWEALEDDRIMSTIAFNKAIGNENIIVPGLPHEMTCSKEAWKETCKKFNAVYDILSEHGMNFGYHNHNTEFTDLDGETAFDIFIKHTHPNIIFQFDCGNALDGKASVMDVYNKCADRLKTVHLKPYSLEDGYATMIGEDDIPWKELVQSIKERNITDWIILEYESTKYEQFEGVRLFINGLKEKKLG